jgi:hypothetical protein
MVEIHENEISIEFPQLDKEQKTSTHIIVNGERLNDCSPLKAGSM